MIDWFRRSPVRDVRDQCASWRPGVRDDTAADEAFAQQLRKLKSGSAPECAPVPDPDAPALVPADVSARLDAKAIRLQQSQ